MSDQGAVDARSRPTATAAATVLYVVPPLRRQPEDALHAVPAVQLAGAPRAARPRGRGSPGPSSSGRSGGGRRDHEVLTGDYASWTGAWLPTAPPGQTLREPEPLFRKLDRRSSTMSSALRGAVIDTHAHLDAWTAPATAGARPGGRGRPRDRRRDHGRRVPADARARRPGRRASTRASGSTPTRPAAPTRAARGARATARPASVPSPSARRGSTTTATTRRATRSGGSSSRPRSGRRARASRS